jgi:hypothetical protein
MHRWGGSIIELTQQVEDPLEDPLFLDFFGRSSLVLVMGKDSASSFLWMHTKYIGDMLDD